MNNKSAIFDTSNSRELPLSKLLDMYRELGVERIIYKNLSSNDNSKNQIYLAGHLTDLGFLPTSNIIESDSKSSKTKDPKRKIKYTAGINLYWLSSTAEIYQAHEAKLIYYPQYPEVRFSGFLARTEFDSEGWMDPYKKGRAEGRVLIFGITASSKIYAYLATPETRIAKEVQSYSSVPLSSVFNEIEFKHEIKQGSSSKEILLAELKRINSKGWIKGNKLNPAGNVIDCRGTNCGGLTLEAEFGVTPNSLAEPDFLGWELKQFSVKKCHLVDSKPLTVMTPEPNGGFYKENGAEAFVRKYGYASAKTPDRFDFTGKHLFGDICAKSGLILTTNGYDLESGSIIDAAGFVGLVDPDGKPIATWSFAKLMDHWKRKHSLAAYIPSLSKNVGDTKYYSYCNNVRLFEGTSINKFLKAIASQHIYYDPGINLKNASTKPTTKRRSQFRIKSSELSNLYNSQEDVDVSV